MLEEALQWRLLLNQGKLMKLYKNTFDVEAIRSLCVRVYVCVWFIQPEGEPPLVAR